jgi:release factor glutamine methyltransferase
MVATPRPPAVWTVLGLLEWSAGYFQERGIDSPRLTAELLLCRVLGLERIGLYTNFDRPLAPAELAGYKELLRRRTAREPVQYILGETHFMGLRFRVGPGVLIPRPETELLVERVVEMERAAPGSIRSVLDIGTGSGCIGASIAAFLPGCRVDAVDVSPDALRAAAENARALGVADRVTVAAADILAAPARLPGGPYDLVVSNPPYVSAEEFLLLEPEVRVFEPAIATTDRSDGLTFYRAIAAQCGSMVRPGGWCLVEVAYNQAAQVQAIFRAAGASNVDALPDYAGHLRIVRAQIGEAP